MSANQTEVVEFRLGDVVSLRKAHPCGSHEWLVDRLGADIGVRCRGCGRHVLIERRAMERRLTGFGERGNLAMSQAIAPRPRDADATGTAGAGQGSSAGNPEGNR